jgi:pilus assembly protein CpaF
MGDPSTRSGQGNGKRMGRFAGWGTRVGEEAFTPPPSDKQDVETLVLQVRDAVVAEFPPAQIVAPDEATLRKIEERIDHHVGQLYHTHNLHLGEDEETRLAQVVRDKLVGLGFLERYRRRNDILEVALNSDGGLWLAVKGLPGWLRDETFDVPAEEVNRILSVVLGSVNRQVSFANPIESARLNTGERLQVVASPIAVPKNVKAGQVPYPSFDLRFFEPTAVPPRQYLEWNALSEEMLDFLGNLVRNRCSVMALGKTGSGKTTLLNALSFFIPTGDRVVSIEDTQELKIAAPNWQPLETRPPSISGEGEITQEMLVATSLRMFPDWVAVGEVRHPAVAAALLDAQASGHAGLSTFHAHSPAEAIYRLQQLLLRTGSFPSLVTAKMEMVLGLDVMVQIRFDRRMNKRRVTEIAQVDPELKRGEVNTTPIYVYDYEASYRNSRVEQRTDEHGNPVMVTVEDHPVWNKAGEFTREIW